MSIKGVAKSPLRRQIVDLYLYGFETTQVAAMLGIHGNLVRVHLHREEIKLRKHPILQDRTVHPVRTEKLREEYLVANLSLRQIAEKYGMSRSTVRARLVRADVQMRKQGSPPGETRLAWKELELRRFCYENMDLTLDQMSERLGRHPNSLRASLIKMGVHLRNNVEGANRAYQTQIERYGKERISARNALSGNKKSRAMIQWALVGYEEEQIGEDGWNSSEVLGSRVWVSRDEMGQRDAA